MSEPSPEIQNLVKLLRSQKAPADRTPGEQRASFEDVAVLLAGSVEATSDPVDAGGVAGEWIAASGAGAGRTLYYLHGGGYVIGSINTHRALIARLSAASGARAFAINYRLAPEHPFPAAVEDAVTGYRWLLEQGVDPAGLVIAGDSAGGGLTVATLVALRDAGVPLPAAAVCLSPWTDMEGIGESAKTRAAADPMIDPEEGLSQARLYLGDADPRTPLAAPLYADLSSLPPMLIHVGDAEVLLDDSTRLAERARAAGVDVTLEVWDHMIHVWHFFAAILPEGQQAIDRIGAFVRERTAAGAAAR
jgi:monoterpene epsilon-lactone hydrolase